jgi:diguanylate cyclase (GGDEF)-like protein
MNANRTSLKSISARANTFSLLVVVASIVGTTLFLLVFQQHTRQDAEHKVDARARVLTYVLEKQIGIYRRIFKRLSERPELTEILSLQDGDFATKWSQSRNRLLPDSVGMGLFTIEGSLLGKPADHYIGKSCLREMKLRVQGATLPQPPVHNTKPRFRHFDLITNIKHSDGSRAGLLFASISTEVLKSTLGQLLQQGEAIELRDGNNVVLAKIGNIDPSTDAVTVTRPVDKTDWTLNASLIVPPPPPFYFWGGFWIVFAAMLVSGSIIYLMRSFLSGLIGEMESIRTGLEKIVSGKFDGSLPKPAFRETADVNAAIERISNLIFRQNQNLTEISETDELTGLFNRRRILHEMKRQLSLATLGAKTIVVLMDLDNFKVINDKHGHAVGDQVLKAFSDALLKTRRGSDLVARMGGDEFIAILIDSSADTGAWNERLTEAFRNNMKQAMLLEDEYCTISAGALVLDSRSGETPESILLRVDNALYKAKENGRSQMVTL